jgi:DNA-binding CsgD family transcriptional regulator
VLSDLRADAVRRELIALGRTPISIDQFQAAAAEVVGRAVPYDATCWASVDPDSHVLSGSVTLQFDPGPELEARFAEVEAAGVDLHSFRSLVGRGSSVARLSDAARSAIDASPRLAEIYRPLGFVHELRAAFTIDERLWGVAGLLRGRGGRDFDDDEVAYLASVSADIAAAIRRAALTGTAGGGPAPGTAVLIVDERGAVSAATPAAERVLGELDQSKEPSVRLAVRSVAAAVRLQRIERASARVRSSTGAWLTVAAAPLRWGGEDAQVAVTIEATSAPDLTELLLAAHGLSPREQEVCREVIAGRSTTDIATRLFISANTVQDHLKSIFDKTGLRSRRELVAHLATTRTPSN